VYRALESVGLLSRPLQKVDSTPYASAVTDRAIHYLESADDRPLFVLAHYMDTHHPYTPDEETLTEFDRHTSPVDAPALFMLTAAMVENPPPLPLRTGELERLVDFYDACIRSTDAEIGRLMDTIRYRDSDRETIVIFTSDHGDEFMEHGSLYHNNLLVEELIRVPLIFWRSADQQPRRVQEMVRHVDVMPTIAELVGLTPPDGIAGQSIAPSVTGGVPPLTIESISEGDFCTAINTPDWKIMHVDSSDTYYLYDLTDDPWGHYDVSHRYPDVFARLRGRIDSYLKEAQALSMEEPTPVNPETLRQLRALGYIQ
jgi:arylsulfatase A-like enzyme